MPQSHATVSHDPVDEMISAAVLGLIAQRRTTAPAVALAVGIGRTAFFNKLNNAAPWKAHEVDQIARFFAVTRDSLYEGRAEFPRAAAGNLTAAGTRSSTDRASDYGSRVGHFRRPRRRRWSDQHRRELFLVPPLRLDVNHTPRHQRRSA